MTFGNFWNSGGRSRPVKVALVPNLPYPPIGEPISPVCPQHNGDEANRDRRRSEDKYARAKNFGGE